MEVLITSKTKYGNNHVCVGGLVLNNNRFIRLLNRGGARNPKGWYQFANTPLNVGDVWDIDFKDSPHITEPHIEDVFIKINHKIRVVNNLSQFLIKSGVKIYKGHIDNLFDGKLKWQNDGKGYISGSNQHLPSQSVGFWISDIDLVLEDSRYFYNYKILSFINKKKSLKWVGVNNGIATIPKGTLIRVSLAKWLPSEHVEDRCYLQLSGWY
ncbi:hypothetical protein [uncultured Wocania sp.]|uniref:dual OB domain-containing protein n=1 Tax=uncultured Wocania sp. TaxID=2834404 RepID=UPI0030F97417